MVAVRYFCTMKQVVILILIGILSSIYGCTNGDKTVGDPVDYLAPDASSFLKIANPIQLKTDLKANSLLNTTIHPILNYISTSEILSAWPSQHPFYFSQTGKGETASFVFTKALDSLSFALDAIPNIVIEKSTIKELTIQKIVLNKDSLFTAKKDSVLILSTSRQGLASVLDKKEYSLNTALKKLLRVPQEGDLISYGTTSLYPEGLVQPDENYVSKSIQVLPDGIQISGVLKSKDSSLLDAFKGQIPQESKIASMLPKDFMFARGITFSDPALLITTLKKQKQDSSATVVHPLLETVTEIAEVSFLNGNTLVMSSIDTSQSLASIEFDVKTLEIFRDVTIYESNLYTVITPSFQPFLSEKPYKFLFLLDGFVVSTDNLELAKNMISAFQNKNVLAQTAYYKLTNTQLLSNASYYVLGQKDEVVKMTNAVLNNDAPIKTISKYPLAVLQYSYDTSFAHLNFVAKEISRTQQTAGTVTQKFTTTLSNPLIGSPQFFTNHRTKGKDVVAQDITNTLYLFSTSGKKLWTKKLDGPILGEVQEIDILRNGKKQLVFTTKNTFYALDRNGKAVGHFPLEFKDPIKQPLAVFDYDNTRKYRFVITQGASLLMYDSKGKRVKGFNFKKTKTPLVFPPKHIRIGAKDYIVLAEENGKATFLSRTGKERISVGDTFKFGATAIQKEGAGFVIISEDKKKHTISTKGKVTSQNLEVSDSYYFKTLGNTKVTLDDNLLRINGILVELPFGIYSEPQLINHNKSTYIAVTDLQEHQVYIYDKNSKLLAGFPVFGTSKAMLGSQGKKLLLVTTGSDKEVLCYQVN